MQLSNELWPAWWFLHTLTCHSVLFVREWELLTPKCVLTIELEPISCFNNVVSQKCFSKFMFFVFRMQVNFMASIMAMNITVHFEFK